MKSPYSPTVQRPGQSGSYVPVAGRSVCCDAPLIFGEVCADCKEHSGDIDEVNQLLQKEEKVSLEFNPSWAEIGATAGLVIGLFVLAVAL